VNHSLKELLGRFMNKKSVLEEGAASGASMLSPFDAPPAGPAVTYRENAPVGCNQRHNRDDSSFAAKLQNCHTRHAILSAELDDVQLSLNTAKGKECQLVAASAHLTGERDKVRKKIKLLREEEELIDQHLHAQSQRLADEVTRREDDTRKVGILSTTLATLTREIEKFELLA
jgi:hypothetical protein